MTGDVPRNNKRLQYNTLTCRQVITVPPARLCQDVHVNPSRPRGQRESDDRDNDHDGDSDDDDGSDDYEDDDDN